MIRILKMVRVAVPNGRYLLISDKYISAQSNKGFAEDT